MLTRRRNVRHLKIGSTIRSVLANAILRGEVCGHDVDCRNVEVSDVSVSPDLVQAVVFVTIFGDDACKVAALQRLNAAAHAAKLVIARSVKLRKVPRVAFRVFDKTEACDSVIRLLDKLKHE